MERLWAPWRIEYVRGKEREPGCLFCTKPAETRDKENLIVHRAHGAFTMMNKFPYNNGHLLVCPYRHVADVCDLDAEEHSLVTQEMCRAIQVLRRVMGPDGFNVGINLGEVAGAGIAGHLHYHVVPRWSGDTNLMPVLGDVKVISEHLTSTYEKLHLGFEELYPNAVQGEET